MSDELMEKIKNFVLNNMGNREFMHLVSYPLTMLILHTHTTWEPVNGISAVISGAILAWVGGILVSPIFDD